MKPNNRLLNQKTISIDGVAIISENINLVSFAPDVPMPGVVKGFRRQGTGQQLTDGSFDFVAKPQVRAQSKLIKKLAHGRASETKDDAIQLTLKVFKSENVNISNTILEEALVAVDAIREYQLRR